MNIKRKVEKNLPQLIEWAMDNDVTDRIFSTKNAYCVGFDRHGFIYFNSSRTMPLYQTFTVEVEEKVNGETILDRLYEVYFDGLKHDTNMFTNTTTNSLITSKTALIYTVIDNQVIVLWEKYTGGFR